MNTSSITATILSVYFDSSINDPERNNWVWRKTTQDGYGELHTDSGIIKTADELDRLIVEVDEIENEDDINDAYGALV